MIQQVRRERMPQDVGGNRPRDPRTQRLCLQRGPERLARHRRAADAHEQHRRRLAAQQDGPAVGQPAAQPGLRLVAERHEAFLVALAAHPDRALAQVHLLGAQAHELGHAQPGGVEQLDHRLVAQPGRLAYVGRREQRFHFGLGERLRQRARQLRRVDQRGRVGRDRAEPQAQPVEVAQRREQPRVAARVVALREPLGQVAEHVLARRGIEAGALPFQPGRPRAQIGAVAGQRVLREAELAPRALEEIVHHRIRSRGAHATPDAARRK